MLSLSFIVLFSPAWTNLTFVFNWVNFRSLSNESNINLAWLSSLGLALMVTFCLKVFASSSMPKISENNLSL